MRHDTALSAVGSPIAGGISAGPAIRMILGVLCAVALWVYSPSQLHAATEGGVTLQVLPKLCVKPAGDELCTMQLSVTWTSVQPLNICVKFQGDAEPLHCWQAQQQGEFSMAAEREGNTIVQLLNAESLEVLREAEINVIERDLRDTRRRRRHAWSIL